MALLEEAGVGFAYVRVRVCGITTAIFLVINFKGPFRHRHDCKLYE